MKNKIKQKIATVSSLILGLTFGLPNQPAQATTETHCVPFGKNHTCVTVSHSGLKVDSVSGKFDIDYTQKCIPNWHYRISFKDKNNNEYAKINGGTHKTCDKSGSYTVRYNKTPFKEGSICASLYDFDTIFITSACLPIKP